MNIEKIKINNIPSIIWGEKSSKVIVAVHGNMSYKEDKVIKILAENATSKGYQVLSFDLPEHGERKNDTNYLCKVQNCVKDLNQIIEYVKKNYQEINLWACSMGAYFSLISYKDEEIKNSLFLSPVVNMKVIIDNMMLWSNITEKELEEKQEIKTDFGQTLYWNYYKYVKENSITKTGATIVIEDKNENPVSWGMNFEIQKAGEDDKWVDLITKELVTWVEIEQQPNEEGITEMQLDWSEVYGELSQGTYRIVKYNGLTTLYSEPFTIEE